MNVYKDNASPQEKRIIEDMLNFNKGPNSRVTKEKNKLKNKGIKIRPKGINILKLSSKVKELVIQCIHPR